VEINARLQKHFDNYGRFNLSVSDSSFDTWLDGYVPGAPARKTNIYDEGSLIALLLDLTIRKATKDKKSLDDLFYQLYNDFAPQHLGYTEKDVRAVAMDLASNSVTYVFNELLNQPVSYEAKLNEMLNYVGCYISKTASLFSNESLFGFRTIIEAGITKVANVIPNSPAENAGLSREDEIISCNGWKVENNLSDLIKSNSQPIQLNVFSQKKLKTITLTVDTKTYFDIVRITAMSDANDQQKASFKSWSGLNFPL
jgi:predicted metalloprotease with PDZ domain